MRNDQERQNLIKHVLISFLSKKMNVNVNTGLLKPYKLRIWCLFFEEDECKGKYRFTKRYVREVVDLIREDIEQTKKVGWRLLCGASSLCSSQGMGVVQDDAANIHGKSQKSNTYFLLLYCKFFKCLKLVISHHFINNRVRHHTILLDKLQDNCL